MRENAAAANAEVLPIVRDIAPTNTRVNSFNSFNSCLPDEAYYGLAGEVVRMIEPHTEADNAALLVQFLSGFGNLINRTAFFGIGADLHYCKIFAVLVGDTSTGRKGTSWSEIRRMLVRADVSFVNAIQDGLSSGEGLIYHVRDAEVKKTRVRGGDDNLDERVEIIGGAEEKRAFIIEPEFARVLSAISRESNTLSSVIRQAWDTDQLSIKTKNPIKATNAHISVIGHITKTELINALKQTETFNGFANRFLWVVTKRSKLLPDGGNLQEDEINDAVMKIRDAISFARSVGPMRRDDEARGYWHQIYGPLSEGHPGVFGAVTSRGPAQVTRLSCVYALLDHSDTIRLQHLQAAYGLWQYCEESARFVFGDSQGDSVSDRVLNAINNAPNGLTATEISSILGRNVKSHALNPKLTALQALGLIRPVIEKQEGQRGRPATRYFSTQHELTN